MQVNWLGFPGSMGADFIDYIVADPFVIPPEAERHYSEKVLRLPDCYQINDRHRQISAQAVDRGVRWITGPGLRVLLLQRHP